MDFSKKGIIKKQHQIKSTTKRLNSKFRIALFRMSLVSVVFAMVAGCFAVYGAAKGMIENSPNLENITIDPEGYTTHMYYSDGTLMQTLIGSEANRVYVTIDNIPKVVQYAFVALEDERFYEHDGIDIRGIFRAGLSVLKEGGLGFGASTITQQLLKNRVFNGGNEKNDLDKITRKVQEQFLAIQLEDQFTKDEILEAYLNTINLGNRSFGVQTAARSYFGKNVEDLTLSEATVLAPLALSPVRCNPIDYPDKNKSRREDCLEIMLKYNFCTKEQYDEALADDVYSRIQNFAQETEESTFFSYYTDEVIEQVLADLQNEKGYTSTQATYLLYSGGLEIFTAQNREIQNIVDKYYLDESNFPAIGEGSYYELTFAYSIKKPDGTLVHYHIKDLLDHFKDYVDNDKKYYHKNGGKTGINSLGYDPDDMLAKAEEFKAAITKEDDIVDGEKIRVTIQPQSAMTIMDQHTGEVVAMYGGRGAKIGNRIFNRATSSVRQVGSTFKVLASFLPALDTAGMTLASVADDSEYYYPGSPDKVTNWYTGGYKGLHTIREGIYNSMNIVACRIMERVTPQVGFDYLERLGFSTLVQSRTINNKIYSDIGIPLALGGLTDGVKNIDMTAGYAAIANNGIYNEPIYYTKVVDHNGKVILSKEQKSTQVMKTSTSWLLTNAMEDTVKIGTGKNLRFREYSMPVAGKTGTVHDNFDLWFVGYTPYYTASIWTGFDNNFDQNKNKSYHQHMWRKIMEEIHSTLELKNIAFQKPDSITSATVCTKCGNLALEGVCSNALGGSCSRSEYFAKGTVPTDKCSCHVKMSVCKDSGHFAGQYCPAESVHDIVYLVKEETSPTFDTPNILPTGDQATPCPVHTGIITPVIDDPSEPENPEDPDIPGGSTDNPDYGFDPNDPNLPDPDDWDAFDNWDDWQQYKEWYDKTH